MANTIKTQISHSYLLQVTKLRRAIALLMELTWLSGLMLVPLVFTGRSWFASFTEPKQNVIHITILILLCLWITDFVLSLTVRDSKSRVFQEIKEWFSDFWKNPYKWAIVFLLLYLLGNVLTLALSPVPALSFFGRNTNEPGNDFYTVASYVAILLIIAVKITHRKQIERILWVAIISGFLAVIYGLMQVVNIDFISNVGALERIGSTFGNALFFSAYVIMAIFAMLTIAAISWNRGNKWMLLILSIGAVISCAIVFSTNSRGPFLAITLSSIWLLLILALATSGTWRRIRAIGGGVLAAVFWIASGANDFSSPLFIAAYSLLTIGVLVILLFEWLDTRKSVLTIISGITILAIQAVLLFAVPSDSIVFSVMYAFLGYAPLMVYLLINQRTMIDIKTDNVHPKSRKKTKSQGRGANRITAGLIFNYGDTRLYLSISVLLVLLLAFVYVFWVSSEFSDRLSTDLTVTGTTQTPTNVSDSNVDMGNSPPISGVNEGSIYSVLETEPFGGAELEFNDTVLTIPAPRGELFNNINGFTTRRLNIWRGAAEIAATRPSLLEENTTTKIARHIWGTGHDLYAVAYPLTLNPQNALRPAAHPHNIFLQVWVEQGIWGIVTYFGLLISISACVIKVFWNYSTGKAKGITWPLLMAIGGSAIFLAHLVDQSANVSRVSDAFLFWAICACLLSLYKLQHTASLDAIAGGSNVSSGPTPNSKTSSRRNKQRAKPEGFFSNGWRTWLPIGALVSSTILAITLFVSVDITNLYHSSRVISPADTTTQINTIGEALNSRLENDVYVMYESNAITTAIDAINSDQDQQQLLNEQRDSLNAHLEASPLSLQGVAPLLTNYSRTFNLGVRDPEFVDDFRQTLIETIVYWHNFPDQALNLVTNLFVIGEYERSIGNMEQAQIDYENVIKAARVIIAGNAYAGITNLRANNLLSSALIVMDNEPEAITTLETAMENHLINYLTSTNVSDSVEILIPLLMRNGSEERAMEYQEIQQELEQYGTERNNVWLRSLIRGRLFLNFTTTMDQDKAFAALNYYASTGPRRREFARSYNEDTLRVFDLLSEQAEQLNYPDEVKECYSQSRSEISAFLEQGGYDSADNPVPALVRCVN